MSKAGGILRTILVASICLSILAVLRLGGAVMSTILYPFSLGSAGPKRPPCFKRTGLPKEEYVVLESVDDPTINHPEREKTTMVFIGYSTERFENFDEILPKYGDMDKTLDRVLLLWNNQDKCPPTPPSNTKVPIYVIPQRTNSLNNRMGDDVAKYARTRSILHVDDDLFLSEKLIRSMIRTFVKSGVNSFLGCFRERRYAHPAFGYSDQIPKEHKAKLKELKHNVVITRTMMLGRRWISKYNKNKKMLQFVNDEMNCEDIMISALVRSETNGRDPIYLPLTEEEYRTELPHPGGLSDVLFKKKDGNANEEDKRGWFVRRGDCALKAQEFFGKGVWG